MNTNLDRKVDELGRLLADIKRLNNLADEIKGDLISAARGATAAAFEGDLFRASVSWSDRTTTNWRKIAADLGASEQKIRGNSKITSSVTVRVSARKVR